MTVRARLLKLRRFLLEHVSSEALLLGLAAVVGVLTGLLAVALIWGVRAVQELVFASATPVPALLVAPFVGGLIVGLIALRLPEVAGGGVTPVMTAIALHGGRMPSLVGPAKLVASAISLGTGASGGREGPIVQIGGGVASTLGRFFALDDEQMRSLIAAGAGAGIAASFNAPLAGIFFAVEIIIGGWRVRSLQTVVVTCVVASVTARELIGSAITYRLPDPPVFGDFRELGFYLLLGLAAAGVGVAFARGEHSVAAFSQRLRVWPPLRTALGAASVGVMALLIPEVLGSGDHLPATVTANTEPVEQLLTGTFSGYEAAGAVLLLMVAKLVATCLSVGTGSSVGSFSPALFLGAALGAAFGSVAQSLLGSAPVDVGGFALVGAAAVLAAAVRAPLTAILLAFELTNDYAMVLPLMLATGVATLLADRFDRESVYTRPLRDRGIVYAEPQDLDLMQTVTVGEIMTADPVTVPATMPLSALLDHFASTRHHGFPVVDGTDRLVGIVTLSDLAKPDPDALDGREPTAGDLATKRVVTVTPSDPVFRAVRRMAAVDVGRLPVVADTDRSKLVGLMRRADVVTAYQRALTRSVGAQQRRQTSRLRDLAGVSFVELTVDRDAPVAGAAVRDVAWPGRTILTSVRRNGEVLVPRGDTVLAVADELVILTDRESTEALRTMVGGRGVGST